MSNQERRSKGKVSSLMAQQQTSAHISRPLAVGTYKQPRLPFRSLLFRLSSDLMAAGKYKTLRTSHPLAPPGCASFRLLNTRRSVF